MSLTKNQSCRLVNMINTAILIMRDSNSDSEYYRAAILKLESAIRLIEDHNKNHRCIDGKKQ